MSQENPRYGFRRVHALLGPAVNLTAVHRIWREEGLGLHNQEAVAHPGPEEGGVCTYELRLDLERRLRLSLAGESAAGQDRGDTRPGHSGEPAAQGAPCHPGPPPGEGALLALSCARKAQEDPVRQRSQVKVEEADQLPPRLPGPLQPLNAAPGNWGADSRSLQRADQDQEGGRDSNTQRGFHSGDWSLLPSSIVAQERQCAMTGEGVNVKHVRFNKLSLV